MSPKKSNPAPDPFPGAVALVTGAGNGIGRATAQALADAGATVIVVDVNAEAVAKTAADVGGVGKVLDVRDRAAFAALADEVHGEHGPLDILVNNAGVGLNANFLDTTAEDWDWILEINLRGIINGLQLFGPAMVARGRGHAVNMSSMLGYSPSATTIGYATTKAAVLQLSRSLRADWAKRGVGVSVVCPGLINSGIITRTEFRGTHAEEKSVARANKFFEKGKPPSAVADAVLDAVRHNRGVVPVGVEARMGWRLRSLLPEGLVTKMAGTGSGT
jgi:NAD(P)-dependent dehydrogenase (short-subunit alcohol dehydrogenase family)